MNVQNEYNQYQQLCWIQQELELVNIRFVEMLGKRDIQYIRDVAIMRTHVEEALLRINSVLFDLRE